MISRHLNDAPDGGWGWMIVVGGFYNLSMWAGFMRCLSVFFNPLMMEFGVEYAAVSRLTGLFQIGYGVFTSVCPLALKHFGARQVCLVASITASVSCFIASLVSKLWMVQLFMGFVVGACTGFLLNSSFTMIARYFRRRHHTANQLACLGLSVGPFAVCPGLQALIDAYGWRGAAQILSAILLNTLVASSLLRPLSLKTELESNGENSKETKFIDNSETEIEDGTKRADVSNNNLANGEEFMQINHDGGHATQKEDHAHRKGVRWWLLKNCRKYHLDLFWDPLFYEYTMSWTWFSITFYATLTYMIPYGQKVLGLSEIQSSVLITAFSGGEIFTRVMYSFILDRIPRRLQILYMVFVFGFTGIAILLFTFISGFVGALIFCVILGILGGGMEAVVNTIIMDMFELHQYSAVLGFSNVTYSVVDSIAIVIIGVIIDSTGNLVYAFYIGCATAIFSSLITYKLHRSVAKIREKRRLEAAAILDGK